ncbi:hypothetical protein CALVIDRAFT_569824 [Calocera viscosa TUFC12733]|uniref:Uncharacterized protein n=1 Tax=Calocera viscosa (strain TUFC12733) TaxID=1330018 RepID=A0A167FJC5_CALVF|nr:hypothetical protein CALVIDRAFT_569824 [Calocera viscosa TUFC12733]
MDLVNNKLVLSRELLANLQGDIPPPTPGFIEAIDPTDNQLWAWWYQLDPEGQFFDRDHDLCFHMRPAQLVPLPHTPEGHPEHGRKQWVCCYYQESEDCSYRELDYRRERRLHGRRPLNFPAQRIHFPPGERPQWVLPERVILDEGFIDPADVDAAHEQHLCALAAAPSTPPPGVAQQPSVDIPDDDELGMFGDDHIYNDPALQPFLDNPLVDDVQNQPPQVKGRGNPSTPEPLTERRSQSPSQYMLDDDEELPQPIGHRPQLPLQPSRVPSLAVSTNDVSDGDYDDKDTDKRAIKLLKWLRTEGGKEFIVPFLREVLEETRVPTDEFKELCLNSLGELGKVPPGQPKFRPKDEPTKEQRLDDMLVALDQSPLTVSYPEDTIGPKMNFITDLLRLPYLKIQYPAIPWHLLASYSAEDAAEWVANKDAYEMEGSRRPQTALDAYAW